MYTFPVFRYAFVREYRKNHNTLQSLYSEKDARCVIKKLMDRKFNKRCKLK